MAEARYKNMWTFMIESNYGDAADIGSDMRCIICTRILINAHNSVCGCRYCLDCVKAYLNGDRGFCPGNTDDCKAVELDTDSNIYPDHAMNYRISKLIVSCRYSCGYRCELRNMRDHDISCQKQSADYRQVNLKYMETRLAKERTNEQRLGENKSLDKLSMESENAWVKGATLELRLEVAAMRSARRVDEVQLKKTNELVDQIKQEVANLRNDNQLANEENRSQKAKIENYRMLFFLCLLIICGGVARYLGSESPTDQQLMELLAQKLGKVEQESRMDNEELRKNIEEFRQNVKNVVTILAKRVLEIGTITEMQTWGEFVWPIDQWASKMQSARDGGNEVVFSEAFYSHKNGYKLCLSVCPNGNGEGKGTHLSVFFHLMRGPFDNMLSWPFKRTVLLSLIDQDTGLNHVSAIVRLENFPNHDDWNKPSTDRGRGLGMNTIIELTTLSTNHKLSQDDRIFIKCVVK